MKTRSLILGLVAALLAYPAGAQTLSPEEQRIVERVDANVEAAIALLARIVSIDSATENFRGVKAVGQELGKELTSIGFRTRWVDMPAAMKRAGHLIAERDGTRGKRLLLLGHLDTVVEGERFERSGAEARGSGVADMKGGDIVLVFALKALNEAGLLSDRQVRVVFTGDEESVGTPAAIARADLLSAAKQSDVALSFEASVGSTATVARRGASFWTLEVSGSTGHSAGIFGPERGSGAIYEAARILTAFHDEFRGEKYLTVNPSIIVGGTDVEFGGTAGTAGGKPNVVAQKVVVRGDMRFISEEQKERVRGRMRAIVSQHLPQTAGSISFEDAYPAMSPTAANMELLRQLNQVSLDLGASPVVALDASERGAGDISFIAPSIAGLDGLGILTTGVTHAPGETADLASLPLLIKRAALLIHRLTR